MKECDIFRGGGGGQNILWHILHYFQGQKGSNLNNLSGYEAMVWGSKVKDQRSQQ